MCCDGKYEVFISVAKLRMKCVNVREQVGSCSKEGRWLPLLPGYPEIFSRSWKEKGKQTNNEKQLKTCMKCVGNRETDRKLRSN